MSFKIFEFSSPNTETDWVLADDKEQAKAHLIQTMEDNAADGDYDGVEGRELSDQELNELFFVFDHDDNGSPMVRTFREELKYRQLNDLIEVPEYFAGSMFT